MMALQVNYTLNPEAANASDALPRPEYPRPQFVRKTWMNLNGKWEFAYDGSDQGMRRHWDDGRALNSSIVVPFAYQTELSGLKNHTIQEIVWYARAFTLPEDWHGKDILLHFGAVDYNTVVFLNGLEVGGNRGGHVPFSFDITHYVKPGENRLTLRVEDKQDAHQPRGKQSVTGLSSGCDYFCTTGIWQTVWLEPVSKSRIEEIITTPIIVPEKPDAFEIRIFVHGPSVGWEAEVTAYDDGYEVARSRQENAGSYIRVFLPIPNATRWTPDTPHLYDLRIRLSHHGELRDEVFTYGGIRTVGIADGHFLLNGEPTYIRSVLDQGYWPESGITAPSDEALKADVQWAKDFGFNAARKHQKVEDPRWLYWCDKMGLMVWGEMPNARAWSLRAEEMFAAEWVRAIERDRNHPCIVTWVPLNESWGVPDLHDEHPAQFAFVERLVALTRRTDPTRPVIDNDGWEHSDVTDIVAIHDYTPTGDALRARYAEALSGGSIPTNVWGEGTLKHFALGAQQHGQPIMLTEVGGFLMIPERPESEWDWLYKIYGNCHSPEELIAQYEDIMKGIADLPFVSGFCYTQLTDIEQEINGLLTYDRKPKVDPKAVKEIHQRLFKSR